MKSYMVELTTLETHSYEVEANTPEEAESIAEQFLSEGEEGRQEVMAVEAIDTLPLDELETI